MRIRFKGATMIKIDFCRNIGVSLGIFEKCWNLSSQKQPARPVRSTPWNTVVGGFKPFEHMSQSG